MADRGGATPPQGSPTDEQRQSDPTMTPSSSPEEDRKFLQDFYYNTNGLFWHHSSGWQDNASNLSTWFGVDCNFEGRVKRLVLVGVPEPRRGSTVNLRGVIPKGLGGLGTLQWLDLKGNKLSGSIPKEMSNLRALLYLDLSNNELKGSIPKELSNLRALQHLDLSNNELKGDIPPALGQLRDLLKIYLQVNQLSGTIPREWGLLRLEVLDLRHNRLTGLGDTASALRLVTHFLEPVTPSHALERLISLENNPWRMPPEALVEKGLDSIKGFLQDLKQAEDTGREATSLQLLKVVLVGCSAAGKTSLLNSIVERKASPTQGDLAAASTVGIELHRHKLKDTKIEFYDCAGQLDYMGMHQTFLSRRALYLLVWDIEKFCNICDVEDGKLDEPVQENIMRWLYTLVLRAPTSTVILVANKRDKASNRFNSIAEKVERRVRHLLKEWENRRDGDSGVIEINLLESVSCVSCHNYLGIDDLITRISDQSSTSILVPPAWDLALKILDALRDGSPLFQAAREHLNLSVDEQGYGRGEDTFITEAELSKNWTTVIRNIEKDIKARGSADEAVLSNSKGALEGALWISEFAGQILAIDDGSAVFLDVVWLSGVLSPILSHKLKDKHFDKGDLTRARDDLVNKGILRPMFACHLWERHLSKCEPEKVQLRESVLKALYCVLLKLGIIIPIGRPIFRNTDQNPLQDYGFKNSALMIMRLDEDCSSVLQQKHESYIKNALKKRDAQEVTLNWKFDVAEVPYGMVERVIASCHAIGDVQPYLCWRYGAVFESRATTTNYWLKLSLYIVVVEYKACSTHGLLRVRMVGPLGSKLMWAALRYVASAVVILSKDWPGLRWTAWPECSTESTYNLYLTSPTEANIGHDLIASPQSDDDRAERDRRLREDKILREVFRNLGKVMDTRTEEPFRGMPDEETPMCNCLSNLIELWRPYAWRTRACMGTIAVIACSATVTGVVEGKDALWQASLGVMGLILLCAAVAGGFFCLEKIREARADMRDGGDEQENAPDVAQEA